MITRCEEQEKERQKLNETCSVYIYIDTPRFLRLHTRTHAAYTHARIFSDSIFHT